MRLYAIDSRKEGFPIQYLTMIAQLTETLALDVNQRYKMGLHGKQYAAQFNWNNIAEKTAEVFKWLLGQASKPECVRIND